MVAELITRTHAEFETRISAGGGIAERDQGRVVKQFIRMFHVSCHHRQFERYSISREERVSSTGSVEQDADVVCVQEIKCSQDDLTPEFLAPHGFQGYFQHAVKKGYSGAGLYTKHKPDDVIIGFGSEEFDPEGRYVEARFGDLSVISVYVPSGSSGEERQQAKYRFMD